MKLTAVLSAFCTLFTLSHAWWKPPVGTTWQIVLSSPLKTPYPNVTALDFDLFDNPASRITTLHKQGHKAICYFSAGSYERWRSDASDFKAADLGKPLDGWPGERWVDTRSANVMTIMWRRMDLAKKKGCDAIDPDKIDVYDNGGGGFKLMAADAVDYVKFLSREGHKRGMAVGLKNGGKIAKRVLGDVDFEVNEQCLQYDECQTFRPFITAQKPVFQIEYRKDTPTAQALNSICSKSSRVGFSTLIKHMNLDAWYEAYPGEPKVSSQSSTVESRAERPHSLTVSIIAALVGTLGLLMVTW